MTITFADVQGFAGAFSCAAAQTGMELVGKCEKEGGFGVPLMEANRAFLGDKWEAQIGDPTTWQPVNADVIVATPPCSGFSSMTAGIAGQHGIDAPINQCMRDLIGYAIKVKPQVVCMESVGQAFTKGLPLMRWLRQTLSDETGIEYHATHVMQNNLSTGGCTNRRRYFLVLSQVPFGVERYDLKRVATLNDALSDLRGLDITWDPQAYADDATWWSEQRRSVSGMVDGHMDPPDGPYKRRIYGMVNSDKAVAWNPGEGDTDMLRRWYETHGSLPDSWDYVSPGKEASRADQMVARGFKMGGFSKPKHWPWDMPGRVVNGAGPIQIWHPDGRFVTHREVARLMGFPDDWVVGTAKESKQLISYWGKGTSVSPAKWLMDWVKASLEGNPGSYVGDELEGGGRLINVTGDWKKVWEAQTGETLPKVAA